MSGSRKSRCISAPEIHDAIDSAPLFDRRSLARQHWDDDALVRRTISTSIRQCAKSREQIADAMTALLGTRVTEKMLNSYTGESNQSHRWPAAWDRAFCQATGDDTLLVCRVEATGRLHVVTETEFHLLELGREYLRQKRSVEKSDLLERQLRDVEL